MLLKLTSPVLYVLSVAIRIFIITYVAHIVFPPDSTALDMDVAQVSMMTESIIVFSKVLNILSHSLP